MMSKASQVTIEDRRRGLERLCHPGARRPGADRRAQPGTPCSTTQAAAPRPSCATSTSSALHASGSAIADTGWAPHFSDGRARRRARRRLPAVPEEPFLRRVRVRLGLGRRLPAPRPALLPEAARRGAVHAGAGPRLLARDAAARARAAARDAAIRARRTTCRRPTCCSSTKPTARPRCAAGWMLRSTVQFHWTNREPTRRTATSPTSSPACSARSARRSSRSGAASREAGIALRRARGRRRSRRRTGTSSTAATPPPTARTTRRPT